MKFLLDYWSFCCCCYYVGDIYKAKEACGYNLFIYLSALLLVVFSFSRESVLPLLFQDFGVKWLLLQGFPILMLKYFIFLLVFFMISLYYLIFGTAGIYLVIWCEAGIRFSLYIVKVAFFFFFEVIHPQFPK